MAELSILPGELDLKLYRGDTVQITLTLTNGGDEMALPADNWLAQIRKKAIGPGESSEVIAEFTVDAMGAADGVIVLVAPDTTELPKKCVWDLQNIDGGATRTYVAGDLVLEGQVSKP